MIRKAIPLLALACALGRADAAPPAATTEADATAFLDATGTFETTKKVLASMMDKLAAQHPEIPKTFWQEMTKHMRKDDFYGLITPSLRKHLTPDDLKAWSAFYKTPAGRHYLDNMGAIAQETMAAAQAWARKVTEEISQSAKSRGYSI
jgi:hypothetical protein